MVISTDTLCLQELREKLNASFEISKNIITHNRYAGIEAAQLICKTTDEILITLITKNFTKPVLNRVSLIATGGYGRGLIAPYSDLDLCILIEKNTPEIDDSIRKLLYNLWDLKLKIGQTIGTVSETVKDCHTDLVKRTALLNRRLIAGSQKIFNDFSEGYKNMQLNSSLEFTKEKLAEREQRHLKSGNSRYLVEPDLKNSKGGLRDINAIFWICEYNYFAYTKEDLVKKRIFSSKDYELLKKSERLFWSIRILLHLKQQRAHEKINFDVQQKLSSLLKYQDSSSLSAVERFMRHYFLAARQVGTITRIFITAFEADHDTQHKLGDHIKILWKRLSTGENDFYLLQKRLDFKEHISLKNTPEKAMAIFKYADDNNLNIHPKAMRFIKSNIRYFDDNFRNKSEPYLIFRELLCRSKNIGRVLRAMSEVGLLGKLIPDFAKIICLMQFNMYHHYTVDEHLIYCVEYMHKIAQGKAKEEHPLASDLINRLDMKDVLFLAVFIHDMAKGRQSDHSEEGEKIIDWLAPRMGFNKAEVDTAKWLVLYHLKMSDISQKRDLSDPKVHKNFAEFVRSSERLKLLLCLTVADICGVGPGVWNGWKGELLRTLYNNTQEILQGGYISDNKKIRVEFKKKDFQESLRTTIHDTKTKMILNFFPDSFWLTTDIKTQSKCFSLVENVINNNFITDILVSPDEFIAVTEIIIYTPDYSGLFTSLSGSLATSGVTIYDAKLFTDARGYALDIFRIQDISGKAITDPEHLKRIQKKIFETIEIQKTHFQEEKLQIKNIQSSATQAVYNDENNVTIDNQGSNSATIIEVTAMNRNFLLYDIAYVLHSLKVSIVSAHINTYGETAIDVFYIKDRFGLKIHDPNFLNKIKQTLLSAIE